MPKSKRKSVVKKVLLKWHKRLGIVSALFVIVLSITGILLNHAHWLKLDAHALSATSLLSLYGVKPAEIVSVKVGNYWLSQSGKNLYVDGEHLSSCRGALVGALVHNELLTIACERELLLFSVDFELIEKLRADSGLPIPIAAIGYKNSNLYVAKAGRLFRVDLDTLNFNTVEVSNINWSAVGAIPKALIGEINAATHGKEITLERVILDIHAGRFLGSFGPLIMDLIALIFIIIALTGSYLWLKKKRKPIKLKF